MHTKQESSRHILTMVTSTSTITKATPRRGDKKTSRVSKSQTTTSRKKSSKKKHSHGKGGSDPKPRIGSGAAGINVEALLQNHVSQATVAAASNLQTMYPTNISHTASNPAPYLAPIPSHMGTQVKQEYPSDGDAAYLQLGNSVVSPNPPAQYHHSVSREIEQTQYRPPGSRPSPAAVHTPATSVQTGFAGAAQVKQEKSINMSLQTCDESWRVHSRSFVKRTLFRSVKFWDQPTHGGFSTDPRTVCGMMASQFNFGTQVDQNQWWLTCIPWIMRMLTDHRNNCIKAMQKKYKGMYSSWCLLL